MNDPNLVAINTDGGARGNPGPAAIGVIVTQGDQTIFALGRVIGIATNNEAEYQAVLASLEFVIQNQNKLAGQRLEWRLDSLLVVSQLTGKYKIKEARLKTLASQCQKLFHLLKLNFQITHVPRNQNARADALVNQALDGEI